MVSERNMGGAEVIRLCDARDIRLEARIRALMAEHEILRVLCARLESFADGLPGLPPAQDRRSAARLLTAWLPAHQQRESALLDELLPAGRAGALERAVLDRIHSQHAMDKVHAQDLGAALEIADGGGEPQALSYMLRCFFDGCRRALAFEELAILKLARRPLSPRAQALLTASLRTEPGLR